MARDAAEQGHQRRLVRWDLRGTNWYFTNTDTLLLGGGQARETPDTAGSLREVTNEILAAVRPKRVPAQDIAGPRQGLSHGGLQW